nr:hypothetical protein [Achromobacter ruhlandii]
MAKNLDDQAPVLFKNHDEILQRERFHASLQVDKGQLDRIVGGYDFDPDKKLLCGLNGCNQPHQRGYVIATKAGDETICGNVCGQRELGVEFEDMANRFVARVDIQNRQLTIRKLQETAAARIEQANALKKEVDLVYGPLQEIRQAFRTDRDLDRVLTGLMRDGGTIRVRQKKTEIQRGLANEIGRENLETIGLVRGIHALRDYALAANLIDKDVLGTIKSVQQADVAEMKAKALTELTTQINGLPAAITSVEKFVSDAKLFLTRETLYEISKLKDMDGVREHKLTPILQKIAWRFYPPGPIR